MFALRDAALEGRNTSDSEMQQLTKIAVCLEFPVVQRGAARFRLSMSPRFSHGQIDRALEID